MDDDRRERGERSRERGDGEHRRHEYRARDRMSGNAPSFGPMRTAATGGL
jgi:hypothetical protein